MFAFCKCRIITHFSPSSHTHQQHTKNDPLHPLTLTPLTLTPTHSHTHLQADGWNSSSAPLYLASAQDLTLTRLSLNGLHDAWNPTARRGPIVHLVLNAAHGANGQEWYRAHMRLSAITLFGSLQEAIRVEGTGGFLDIRDLHVGSTGSQDFYGNIAPNVSGPVINNTAGANAVSVFVDGGFAVSELPDTRDWFVGVEKVLNVRGGYSQKDAGMGVRQMEQLRLVKSMFEEGLITADEWKEQRQNMLQSISGWAG